MNDNLDSGCWNLAMSIILIILSSLPIAAIVIGGSKHFNCPYEPKIPLWLTVFGVFWVGGYFSIVFMVKYRGIFKFTDIKY